MSSQTTPRISTEPAAEPTPRYGDLRGKVAVITGAGKGIGHGIAQRLAAEGMRIVAADFDQEALEVTTTALRNQGSAVLPCLGDLSKNEAIEQTFAAAIAEYGTVDLLVNNAADLQRKRLLDDHEAVLDLQLVTNIRGPYVCSRHAAEIMRAAGGGSIVHISSVGGLRAHHRGLPYDITKGAIDAMTRAMAIDLGPYGIRVNAVAPGVTYTYRTEQYAHSPAYQAGLEGIPLRRSGTVFDIAAAVAFLASVEASYITGQVLYVDGGLTAQLTPPYPTPGELPQGGAGASTDD